MRNRIYESECAEIARSLLKANPAAVPTSPFRSIAEARARIVYLCPDWQQWWSDQQLDNISQAYLMSVNHGIDFQ